jgi:hypothetical protein
MYGTKCTESRYRKNTDASLAKPLSACLICNFSVENLDSDVPRVAPNHLPANAKPIFPPNIPRQTLEMARHPNAAFCSFVAFPVEEKLF